jgi:hypothetical protein
MVAAATITPLGASAATKIEEAIMGLGRRMTSGVGLGKWTWDFRSGQSVLEDRLLTLRGWEAEQRNVENNKFRAVLDAENIQLGWIAYLKGEGLNAKLVPLGQDYSDPPSDQHKEGLRLVVKMDASLGGEVRELISTSQTMWSAISQLHDAYLAGVGAHPGCLPAVDIVDTHKETTPKGPMYSPVFKIVGWAPRPSELPAGGIPLVKRAKKSSGSDSDQANDEFAGPKARDKFARPKVRDEFDDEIPFG